MNNTFVKIGDKIFRMEAVTNVTHFMPTQEGRERYQHVESVTIAFVDGGYLTFTEQDAAQVYALFEGMALDIAPVKD